MQSQTLKRSLCALSCLLFAFGCKPEPKGSTATSDADASAAPAQHKILRHTRSSDYASLDPMAQFDKSSIQVVSAVYDTLLDVHFTARPYKLTPNLAAAMPTVSPDGRSVTIDLREGVHFIDDPCFDDGKGRALTAQDVVYSFKRFADANVNSVSFYALLNDRVVGMNAFREATKVAGKQTDYAKIPLEGVKATGPLQVTLTLVRKDPLAIMALAASPLSIVPREAVERYGQRFGRHPVGTGPFLLTENPRRGRLVLKKNPRYHMTFPSEGADTEGLRGLAGKQLPLLDEVHLPLVEEAQPRMLKFLAGESHILTLDKDAFGAMVEKRAGGGFELKGAHSGKYRLYADPALYIRYYTFNMKDPLLGKNKALRLAIAHALNTPGFLKTLRKGLGIPLETMVPVPIAGSQRDTGLSWHGYDLTKAAAYLVEAGYPEGKGLAPITLEYTSATTDARQDFEFQRAQLAKIGVVLEANFQTFTQYLKKLESQNYQLALSGWGADYPDAENFYNLLYGGNDGATWRHPEYESTFEKVRAMEPGPQRLALVKRLGEIVKQEVPVLLAYEPISLSLTHKSVSPTRPNMMMPQYYKYLDLEADETR